MRLFVYRISGVRGVWRGCIYACFFLGPQEPEFVVSPLLPLDGDGFVAHVLLVGTDLANMF